MKKMKTILAMAIPVVFAATAIADTYTDANGVEWRYSVVSGTNVKLGLGENGAASLAMSSSTNVDASQIPWTFTKDDTSYRVTQIAPYAFKSTKLTGTLSIPSSVTSIGSYAFWGCSWLTGISSLGGVTGNWTQSFPETGLTGVIVIPDAFKGGIDNYAFYHCVNLTGLIVGNQTTLVGRYFAYDCDKLKGIWVKGRSGNNYTTVRQPYACHNNDVLKVVLYGWNTTLDQNSAATTAMFTGVTGCKVFYPANGKWNSVLFGGTNTDAIQYGTGKDITAISVDQSANTISFTPATETGLVKSLQAAPLFKDAFGWDTKINIVNTIEVTGTSLTKALFDAASATFDSLRFAVKTQAQLDTVLAAAPESVTLVIDPTDATETLTVPLEETTRTVYMLLPPGASYERKKSGFIIIFQ